ncbi:MAG: WbqC family protein [Bacteroidales bacterium]|nr:WbqC family protein [Bacteroidales bacterium]
MAYIRILLSTAYLGPVTYFAALFRKETVFIDAEEHYIKQSYRNRCLILTANGVQALIIPVVKTFGNHTRVKDIRIDYNQKWQQVHWNAICSAYNKSPFFLYYRDLFEPFYHGKTESLLEYNMNLTRLVMKSLSMDKQLLFTQDYTKGNESGAMDLRNSIHPKIIQGFALEKHVQVFSDRWPFYPDLSIIDLLFNEGPHAKDYLKKAATKSDF